MKPLLFIDFDGVLCFERFWRGLPKDEYRLVDDLLLTGNRPMIDKWMRGGYTSEEIHEYLSEKTGIPYERLWNVFVEDTKTMPVSQEVLEAVSRLRDRYQTILITVNMDSFDRFTVPALSLDTYFDMIVNSFSDGRFKYEDGGSMFLDAAKKIGGTIDTAYLIDDSQRNCDVFNELGGTALKVDAEHSTLSHLERLEKIEEAQVRS